MSNVKRPFSALQDLPQVFSEPPSTTKKLKLTYDHPLKLYARLSATSTDRSDAISVDFEDNSFTLNRTKDEFNGKESNTYDKFHFNQILNPQTSQEEIMKTVSLPLLEDLVRHDKSGVIFLYGSKSCDKTHSLLGDANDPGLLPRCLKTLLDYRTKLRQGASEDIPLCAEGKLELFEERKKVTVMKSNVMNVEFKICFEAFEICNDDIYDLLRDGKSYGLQMKQKLQLKEKDSQRVFVKDLSNIEIATDQQAIEALSRFRNKLEEDEAIFSLSGKGSKSHYVFKITAKKSQKNGFNNSNAFKGNKSYTTASLCIVQLAGSDKVKKFGGIESLNKTDTGAANANKSLTILARCLKDIKELREGQNANAHSITNTWTVSPVGKPPMFKDSKLTRFLYEYFLEDGNLRLIAHLNTNSLDLEETTRTLNFTSQLRGYSYIEKSQGPSVAKSSVRKMLPFGENLSNNKSIVDKTNQENFKSLVSAATMRIEALVKGSDSTNKRHMFEDSSNKIRKQMSDILDEEEPNLELGEPTKFNARLQTTFMPLADVSGQENLLDDVSFADFMETEAQTNGVSSRLESELYSKMTTIQLLSLPTIAEENFVEAIQEETPVKPAEKKPAENEEPVKVSSPLKQDIVAVKESPVKQTTQEEVLELEAPISTNQSSMLTESCLPVGLFVPPCASSKETDVMETETLSPLLESKVAHNEEVCLNLSNNILPEISHKENPVEEVAPIVEAMETENSKPENENALVQNAQSESCLQIETVAPVLDTSVLIEEKPCETAVEVVPEISCVPVLEHAAPEFDASIIIEEKPCEKIVVQEAAQPDIIFIQSFKKISPVKPIVVEDMPSVNSSIMEAEVHIELIEDNVKSAPSYRRASFDEPMKPRSKNILALNEKAASAKSTNSESSNKMLQSNLKSDFKSNTVTPKRVVSKAIITEKGNGPSSVGKENHLSMSQPHGRRNSLKTPGMTPNVGSKSKPMQAKTSVKKNEDKIRESNAKDLKIKLLEGILQKLQEKVCFKSINDKLQVINENFKKSLKGLMKPETIQSKAELFTFSNNFWATMAASAENNQAALGSLLKEADPSVPLPPINVNYFVFNGAMESKKLNSLETILKTHADNSMNQNNIFILDNNDKVLVEEPQVKIEKSAVKGRGGRKTKEKAVKQEYQEMIVEEEKQQGSRYNTRGRKKKEVELKGRTMCKLEDTPSVVILDSDNEEAKIEIEIEVISDSDDVMIIEQKDVKKDIIVKKEMIKKEIEDPKPIASRTRGKAKERK